MRYYHAENCNRDISYDGFRFQFQPYESFAGTWRGVYATEDTRQIEALDILAVDPASAITRLTVEDYEVRANRRTGTPRNAFISAVQPRGEGSDNGAARLGLTYPPVTQQTDWSTGIFFFNASRRPISYLNPSIVELNGERLLFVRRFIYINPPGGTSDLVCYKLGKNNHPLNQIVPVLPHQHPGEQWDDPRAMVHDGNIFMSFAVWVHQRMYPAHQIVAQCTYDKVTLLAHPEYRGNGSAIHRNTRPQKNWLWFWHDDAWHFVYSACPHIVARTLNWQVERDWETTTVVPWKHGEIRGGTPPVRCGDEYVTFFHSSQPGPFNKRRYFMGAYAFMAQPPFKLTRITPEPLLVGSEHDQRIYGSPCVVFPGGAVLGKDGNWFVVYGINDENCGWIDIPNRDLNDLMQPL